MLRVFETFSGIGSQAKALKNAGIEHEIIATADWDVGAIVAYDLIHNGPPTRDVVTEMSVEDVDLCLDKYSFSLTGKIPTPKSAIRKLSEDAKRRLLSAVFRSNNLVNITDIKGSAVPKDVDLLTYSFPCQDLSLCKFWHGTVYGIDRNTHTRSGMLWEVERILLEMQTAGHRLPRFLLMENVCAILNYLNKKNFDEWKLILKNLGYMNIVYRLNAKDFGIPQNRERAYMISIRTDGNMALGSKAYEFFRCSNDLQNQVVSRQLRRRSIHLQDVLRLDYSNPVYKAEADESQPNDTESRRKIYETNVHLLDDSGQPLDIVVNTVTTKQDRHPNSGVIKYSGSKESGACYRNLTPRECFLLMGFDEADVDILLKYNLPQNGRSMLFSRDKLIKMAGNSIVVDVLECLFRLIDDANTLLWNDEEGCNDVRYHVSGEA